MTVEPLVMDSGERTILAIDTGDNEELMALSHDESINGLQ